MEETEFYSDDVKLLHDMVKAQWDLDIDDMPSFSFVPEQYFMQSRTGSIYFYQVSRSNRISTTDHRTLHRTSVVSIRVANRFRDRHFKWCDEVYRILMANRRAGQDALKGYTYLEVTGDRMSNEASGWYVTTFDVKLTTYNRPIVSDGFGAKKGNG